MSYATIGELGAAVKAQSDYSLLEKRGCLHLGRKYAYVAEGDKPWGEINLGILQRFFRAIGKWLNKDTIFGYSTYSNTRFSVVSEKMKTEKLSDDILGNLGRLGVIFKEKIGIQEASEESKEEKVEVV